MSVISAVEMASPFVVVVEAAARDEEGRVEEEEAAVAEDSGRLELAVAVAGWLASADASCDSCASLADLYASCLHAMLRSDRSAPQQQRDAPRLRVRDSLQSQQVAQALAYAAIVGRVGAARRVHPRNLVVSLSLLVREEHGLRTQRKRWCEGESGFARESGLVQSGGGQGHQMQIERWLLFAQMRNFTLQRFSSVLLVRPPILPDSS
eukprot:3982014-Pleurochrysis_carterae.AAC.1